MDRPARPGASRFSTMIIVTFYGLSRHLILKHDIESVWLTSRVSTLVFCPSRHVGPRTRWLLILIAQLLDIGLLPRVPTTSPIAVRLPSAIDNRFRHRISSIPHPSSRSRKTRCAMPRSSPRSTINLSLVSFPTRHHRLWTITLSRYPHTKVMACAPSF